MNYSFCFSCWSLIFRNFAEQFSEEDFSEKLSAKVFAISFLEVTCV